MSVEDLDFTVADPDTPPRITIPPDRPTVLNAEERAYRRGALQCLQFALASMPKFLNASSYPLHLAEWEQALLKARDSEDPRYLGHYMDEIRKDVGHT